MLCLSHHGWWFLNFFHHITFHRILIALCLCCSYVLMLTKSVLKYMQCFFFIFACCKMWISEEKCVNFFYVLQIFSSIFFTLSGFWTLALVVVAQCNMRRQYNILYLFFFLCDFFIWWWIKFMVFVHIFYCHHVHVHSYLIWIIQRIIFVVVNIFFIFL